MGWFSKPGKATPVAASAGPDPALEALILVLDTLESESESELSAAYKKLADRLRWPPAPTGVVREVSRLLGQRKKAAAARPTPTNSAEFGDLARTLANTMRRAALLDPSLDRRIAEFRNAVPNRMGVAEARALDQEAKALDQFARPVRQRTVDDRREMTRMLREVSKELAHAGSTGSHLHDCVALVVDSLEHQPAPESVAEARRHLLAQIRDVAADLDQLRGDLETAQDQSRGLEVLLESQAAELLDVKSRSALDPLTEVCNRGTFDKALDPLTEVCNRGTFDKALVEMVKRSGSTGQPLSLLILDLDRFKGINDRYGHPAGDKVLIAVAAAMVGQVRDVDLVARVGGEEFAILLPGAAEEVAQSVAERIRAAVAATTFLTDDGQRFEATLSLGAGRLADSEDGAALYGRVDRALYEAKESGRNQTILAA